MLLSMCEHSQSRAAVSQARELTVTAMNRRCQIDEAVVQPLSSGALHSFIAQRPLERWVGHGGRFCIAQQLAHTTKRQQTIG